MHLGVVPGLEGLCILSIPGALGLGNQVIQAAVDDPQVLPKLALTGDHRVQQRHLPAPDATMR